MSDHQSNIGSHVVDAAKASPALAFWVTWFWGFDWTTFGAFLMAVYAVLLIVDKIGLLDPIKRWAKEHAMCVMRRLFPKHNAPAP